jgi:hypothetical protein
MFEWLKKKINPIQKANCPYCSCELDKFPTRKQKCKSCGNEFLVRTHYLTKDKIVLTEKDASKYDVEKEKYYTDKSLIDGLKMDVRFDDKLIDGMVKKQSEILTERFGHTASLGDIAWGVANKLIIDITRSGETDRLHHVYFQMALYLNRCGKDYSHLLYNCFEISLKRYKKSDVVKSVKIRTVDGCCEQCKPLEGMTLTVDEALEKKILPCKECSFKLDNQKSSKGWCRCCYLPEVI